MLADDNVCCRDGVNSNGCIASILDPGPLPQRQPPAIGGGPLVPFGIDTQLLGRVHAPVRIVQRLSADRDQIRQSGLQDRLGLRSVQDHAAGHGGNAGGVADRLGMGELKAADELLALFGLVHQRVFRPYPA